MVAIQRHFLLILVVFALVGVIQPIYSLTSDTSLSQTDDEETIKPGVSIPNIDGIDENTQSSQYIGEWEDSTPQKLGFQDVSGLTTEINYKIKHIGGNLYWKMEGKLDAALQQFQVALDMDNDATESQGDTIITTHIATGQTRHNLNLRSRTGLSIRFADAWARNAMIFGDIPDLQERRLSYSQFLVTIVQIKVMPSKDDTFTIEGKLNLVQLKKWLNDKMGSSLALSQRDVGDTLSYGMMLGTDTGDLYGWPDRGYDDPDTGLWLPDSFGSPPIDYIPPFSINYNVGIEGIEVTQAIQTADNDLRLALHKETLARVFIDNRGTQPINVEVTLHAYAWIVIFPIELGSLTTTFDAPANPNRNDLDDSANFELPAEWESTPWLILTAEVTVVNQIDDDLSDNTLAETFIFEDTHDFNIYYVRVNTGTTGIPEQISTSDMDDMKTGIDLLYPTNANWIELDSSVIGPFSGTVEDLKDELHDLIAGIYVTIILQAAFGLDPWPIPDQVVGVTENALLKASGKASGGSSTPIWNGGDSMVAYASNSASSGQFVIAHEVMHNLGDDETGRHVSDPNDINSTDWGCGAGGSNLAWPGNDDDIAADNSDALGWDYSTGDLVPGDENDLMSYCDDLSYPDRWVSDYRWEALFDIFTSFNPGLPGTLNLMNSYNSDLMLVDKPVPQQSLGTSRVVRGVIYPDGSGSLRPSYSVDGRLLKGDFQSNGRTSTHDLRFMLENGSIRTIPLYPTFNERAEGDPDRFTFAYWLPDNGKITHIRLRNGTQIIDQLSGTGFTTSGDFTHETELKRGTPFIVDWSGLTQSNSTPLRYQLQYSPDGVRWQNIMRPTFGDGITAQLDNRAPGTVSGHLRLRISDGFDTLYLTSSDNVTLDPLQKRVKIGRYKDKSTTNLDFRLGSAISFDSDAFDPNTMRFIHHRLVWQVRDFAGTVIHENRGRRLLFEPRTIGTYTVSVGLHNSSELSGLGVDQTGDSDSLNIQITSNTYATTSLYQELVDLLSQNTRTTSATTTSQETSSAMTSALPLWLNGLVIPVLLIITRLRRPINKS